jgi:mannose-6-phosphate isomerase-like protein (cupin superfamily)
MIVRRESMQTEVKEQMRGGKGSVHYAYFVPNGAEKNARMLAELTLEPGSSIGCHQHDNETEYFIFIAGTGLVVDNGEEFPIKAGDVMITGNGGSHSVENNGSVPLVFNAIIVAR